MFLLGKYCYPIDQFICSKSSRAFLFAFGLLAIAVSALGALFLVIGAPAMSGYLQDVPVLLDGAWRIINGQVPHRDFYNFLGDLPFYVVALGMKLSHPCASAIDYGNVIVMAVVALAAALLLYRRTTALCAFLYSLFIALLVITPRSLGAPSEYSDHAMLYNRYGEAFIALLGIILFLPRKPDAEGRIWNWLEAAFVGFLLVAALGSKMNYFAVSVGFLVLACVTRRIGWGHLFVCLISATAFLSLALALTKIPLAAMWHDYRIVAVCQKTGQSLGYRIHTLFVQSVKGIPSLVVLLLLVWEAYLGEGQRDQRRSAYWRHVIIITVIVGAAILLLASNAQRAELPLLALAALYVFELLQRQPTFSSETPVFITTRHCAALLVAAFFLFPSILANLRTIRYVQYAALHHQSSATAVLQSTRLNDFRIIPDDVRPLFAVEYTASVDDGIQLLRRHCTAKTPVNILVPSNPFHVALDWPPPLGGTICVADMTMTPQSHPTLARLLGNAPYILTDHKTGAITIKKTYGPEWDALGLKVIEDTKYYTLYAVPSGLTARGTD